MNGVITNITTSSSTNYAIADDYWLDVFHSELDLLSRPQLSHRTPNGTVTYTYSNGLLASRTDAKGQVFGYGYDGYNQLQQITLNASVRRTFIYDTNTLDASFTSYGAGRLVAVQHPSFTAGATRIQFNEMYSYAIADQPTKKRLQINETPPYPWTTQSRNLDAAYSYDTEG